MISSKELIIEAQKKGYKLELRTLRDYVNKGLLPKPIAKKRQKETGQGGGMVSYFPDKASVIIKEIFSGKEKGLSLQAIKADLYYQEYLELIEELSNLKAQTHHDLVIVRVDKNKAFEDFMSDFPKIKKIDIDIKFSDSAEISKNKIEKHLIGKHITGLELEREELLQRQSYHLMKMKELQDERKKRLFIKKAKRDVEKFYLILKNTYGLSSKEKRLELFKWIIEEQKNLLNEAAAVSEYIEMTMIRLSDQDIKEAENIQKVFDQDLYILPKDQRMKKIEDFEKIKSRGENSALVLNMLMHEADNEDERIKELQNNLTKMERELQELQAEVDNG